MQEASEIVWQAITAVATSLVAISVLIRGLMWCIAKWKRRVSWSNLETGEQDVVWGVGISQVSTICVDYAEAFTTNEKPLAFVSDGRRLAADLSLRHSDLHLHPIYVIHLESLQDRDLVRPYSKMLLDLSPNTYSARPRMQQLIKSKISLIEKHGKSALKRVNFVDIPSELVE